LRKRLFVVPVVGSRNPKNSADVKLKINIVILGHCLDSRKLGQIKHCSIHKYGLPSPQVTGKYSQLSLPEMALHSAECFILNFAHTIIIKP